MDEDKLELLSWMYFPFKMTSYILELVIESFKSMEDSDEKELLKHISETQKYRQNLFKHLEKKFDELKIEKEREKNTSHSNN